MLLCLPEETTGRLALLVLSSVSTVVIPLPFLVALHAVVAAALEAQVDGGHAGVHRPGGALPPGIRRQGQSLRSLLVRFSSLVPETVRRGKVGPHVAVTILSRLS